MAEQVYNGSGRLLSSAQRRLWLAHVLEPTSAEFTAPWVGRLHGHLDLDALHRAWLAVVERHAELRLRLCEDDGEPSRSEWPVADFVLPVREIAPDSLSAELDRAATRVFDLLGGRLIDAELLVLGPDEHVLLVNAHHAVIDGRSMALITDDLWAAYSGRDLAPPARSYLDYVDREVTARPSSEQFDSWVEDLRIPQRLEPLGFEVATRSADKGGSVVRVPLPQPTWEAVREFSRRHRTTAQVLGLSALALTLGRYTDTDDLVIGSTMDTRSGDFVDTVGMFINPAPVRVHIDPAQSVSAFCRAAQRSLLRAFAHRSVPFEEVVRRLQVAPDITRTPVFQVLFNFEALEAPQKVPGLEITALELPVRISKYDLTLVLRDNGPSAELLATYRSSRYERSQIEQLTGHVAAMLGEMLAADEAAVGSLAMLTEAERGQLLTTGRGPALPDGFRPVHEAVADIALTDPDRPAVHCASTTLTYRELVGWSDTLAAELNDRGVRRGTPVAVLMEPSAEMVVAVLAVLRAGGVYIPLNPGHPEARLTAVLADAGADLVVGDASWRSRLPQVRVLSPDRVRRDGAPSARHRSEVGDAAYTIYTSGTTGEPKGVVVEHGTLAASTAARRMTYGGCETFLLVSPLSFDSSVAGLWGTLVSGGRLVVAQTDEVRDPERLVRLIETHGVTAMLSVPALYAGLLNCAERTDPKALRTLDVVITAGEALPETLVTRHFGLNPSAALVNEYGPTEATVWSTYRRFEEPGPVDIGHAAPGASLYVLDRRGRLMPFGTSGELHIGGRGVARGYLGRPALTDGAFLLDPYSPVTGARAYRTGDWVRWGGTGGLQFLGRHDHLVKVRGHRVELGAVESALRSYEGVTEAAVLLAPGGASLTAFLVADPRCDLPALRRQLTATLPSPMVPSVLRVVTELPRTAHGKVDHDTLRALDSHAAAPEPPAAPGPVAPATGADPRAVVQAAWCAVLQEATVETDVNFFDAGGHSLLVPLLQMEIEDRAQVRLAIVDLFTATTVDAQAALIAGSGAAPADHALPEPDLRRARLAAGRSRRTAGSADGS